MVNAVTHFRICKGDLEYSKTLVASGCVAMSSGCLAEPSQIVLFEIQHHVELGVA